MCWKVLVHLLRLLNDFYLSFCLCDLSHWYKDIKPSYPFQFFSAIASLIQIHQEQKMEKKFDVLAMICWKWDTHILKTYSQKKKKKKGALNQSLTIAIKSQSWLLEAQQAITWGCGKGQRSVHFSIHFQS